MRKSDAENIATSIVSRFYSNGQTGLGAMIAAAIKSADQDGARRGREQERMRLWRKRGGVGAPGMKRIGLTGVKP